MAKKSGTLSAIHMQTAGASTAATGIGLSRIGTTLWYGVASATNYYWDRNKAIVIYDVATPVVPLEIDYVAGAVRLSAAAGGAVTADVYKFACTQVGGFKSHSIDENMTLVECGCYEDVGEQYEPTVYNASGQAEGFYTTVDAKLTMALGANKDLEFTSLVLGDGPADDGVSAASLEIVVAGNNTPLTVVVTTPAIVINSATGAGGAATSTARAIMDALQASADAMALIKVKLATGSDGSGIPGAVAHAHMTGGVDLNTGAQASYTTSQGAANKNLRFIAQAVGVGGNAIDVTCVVAGANTPLTVDVAANAITINSATNAGSEATSTAAAIRAAIIADAEAFALITCDLATGSDGTGVFGAMAKVDLVGGINHTEPDRFGQDLVAQFFWDSGAALIRTVGVITLEKVSLKTGIKDLVGRTISFKFQGFAYDHSG
jgi:hypothetical protein